jgi:phospholipase C
MRPLPRFYYVLLVIVAAGVFALVLHGCQGVTDPKSPSGAGAAGPRGPLSTDPNNESRKLNHFVILIQENRSMDTYFGQLSAYWAANGFPSQAFDGMPSGASNKGCDPNVPAPGTCTVNGNSQPVGAFHLTTSCIELISPDWNDSHLDVSLAAPASGSATMDGFVIAAGQFARSHPPVRDVNGLRAMGFYDGTDLNYYYFMASNFATSDRWYSPVMSVTQPNRMYLLAATSHGHVWPLFISGSPPLTNKTIFQLLQENGISWKIYVHPDGSGCTSTSCLIHLSYINMFSFQNDLANKFPQNIAPIGQYFSDLKNGTLPQVALIEPASQSGLDEHPSNLHDAINMQNGARYASSLINALMHSSSWKDSAFILSYDEFGGLFDHVAPMSTASPDGIPPSDLRPGDVCFGTGGANCDFTLTGLRVPLIVISPFAKKNFVSHNPADYTAILRLLEHRFGLPSLTSRDAFQMDMTEFFDFNNPPWMTPPNPPAQNMNLGCHQTHLP